MHAFASYLRKVYDEADEMIRIIYSWKVEKGKQEAFIETWKRTTNSIHKEVKGARGSFMLQNDQYPEEIKTVARWDALDDWKQFWTRATIVKCRPCTIWGNAFQ